MNKVVTTYKKRLKTELHSWTQWEVIKNEEIGYSYWLLVQKRKCTSCGLTEIKKEVK